MRAFTTLLLVTVTTFLFWILTAQFLAARTTTAHLSSALRCNAILIGDSHAQNIPWPKDQSAFILPGSGLFHTYLVIKRLTHLRKSQSSNTTFVATIWPGTFNRDQENRYTGVFRDSWGAAIGGRTCNYWSMQGWINPEIPTYLKTRALLGKIQISRTNTQQNGNNCNPEIRLDTDRLVINEAPYSGEWLSEGNLSWWFFNRINQMVIDADMRLIWVSTPTHPNFSKAISCIEDYKSHFPLENDHIIHFNALDSATLPADIWITTT